ncbi:MAG: FkbM family methyltransferase [Lachnospiraceae bacterium]|nr:FkbM family methyltransferase [Lachnospiraceae bacterium]
MGLASIFFASKGFIKRVYGFEPFKPTYERAIENIGLNSAVIRDKIETFPYGLGDSNDTRSFVYNKENHGIMRTGQGSVVAKPEDENVETVEIREAGPELIKIMDQYPDAFFAVKMDCEGGEFDIYPNLIKHGAFDRIGYIMMETHDGKEDLLVDMLSNEGFIV